jgi:hypothetical protein
MEKEKVLVYDHVVCEYVIIDESDIIPTPPQYLYTYI